MINFGCDPERADELTHKVFGVIDSLKTYGTDASYLQRSRETTMTAHRVGLEENGYWLRWLQFYDRNELPITDIPEGVVRFYSSVTVDDIQESARTFLDDDNLVRVVLYPDGWGDGND